MCVCVSFSLCSFVCQSSALVCFFFFCLFFPPPHRPFSLVANLARRVIQILNSRTRTGTLSYDTGAGLVSYEHQPGIFERMGKCVSHVCRNP